MWEILIFVWASCAQESSQDACLVGVTAAVLSRGNMLKAWHWDAQTAITQMDPAQCVWVNTLCARSSLHPWATSQLRCLACGFGDGQWVGKWGILCLVRIILGLKVLVYVWKIFYFYFSILLLLFYFLFYFLLFFVFSLNFPPGSVEPFVTASLTAQSCVGDV